MVSTKNANLAEKIRLVAREGAADYPSFLRFGLSMSLNDVHILMILHWLNCYEASLERKRALVDIYHHFFANIAKPLGANFLNSQKDRHIFHKYILALPCVDSLDDYIAFTDQLFTKSQVSVSRIVQPSLPTPPFQIDYLHRYLFEMGRPDLICHDGHAFPGWSAAQSKFIYLSTHHLVDINFAELTSKKILDLIDCFSRS